MKPEEYSEIERIFNECVKASEEERLKILERLGKENPRFREEVEALLVYAASRESIPGDVNPFVSESGSGAAGLFDLIGNTIGDYHVIREIGRGGMGIVFEAEQISLKRKVALKILNTYMSASEGSVQKFYREAEAAGRQKHPGIVAVYAVGEHGGVHYIVQELVEDGTSLHENLDAYRERSELPPGYFRDVAQLVSSIADALQHAHESGVIHRDIKPSNILITREGQPKVTDFGLAKIEDALALSRTGDFAGTPYYMSPEQAMSRRMGIDHRTDIYSLGVTLYEMLTLRVPFKGETSQEVFRKIILHDPQDPCRSNPRVPRDLAVICFKAIEKDANQRYPSMKKFAEDLERYLSGDVILAKPAGLGTRLWKRVKRNPVVSAAVGVALLAAVVFAVVVPWVIANESMKREEQALAAKIEIEKQQEISEERYEQIIRLADVKRLTDLEAEAERLWPAYPEKIDDLEAWIERADDLVSRLDIHDRTLEALRGKALPFEEGSEGTIFKFSDVETQWQHQTLGELVSGIERLKDDQKGLLRKVKERLTFASMIEKWSIDDHREAWDKAIASIADEEACPEYGGLKMNEMIGFVPIGRDPDTGLWEFAHLQTGEKPERSEEGKLSITEKTGLVFVLIPGGDFMMGSILPSQVHQVGSPNVDPHARPDESPIHLVKLKPFLLSKFEMTQGQWMRLAGENPSAYNPKNGSAGWSRSGEMNFLLHPVEQVSWIDCTRMLNKLRLRLPTEAEWEYACRAGTGTVWWTGKDVLSLHGAVNLCDEYCKTHGGHPGWSYEEGLDDGYTVHAPVGCLRPNAFGLHDIQGNVWEWCRDNYEDDYQNAPVDGSALERVGTMSRVARGGSYQDIAQDCRSADRDWVDPDSCVCTLGLRPAISLQE